MSVQLDYGNGTEIIENLPLGTNVLNPVEYGRIMPLLEEGSVLIYPLRKYLYVSLLFIILSIPQVHQLVYNCIPGHIRFEYTAILIKTLIFITILYILDYFIRE